MHIQSQPINYNQHLKLIITEYVYKKVFVCSKTIVNIDYIHNRGLYADSFS